jgi:hypothetical protein
VPAPCRKVRKKGKVATTATRETNLLGAGVQVFPPHSTQVSNSAPLLRLHQATHTHTHTHKAHTRRGCFFWSLQFALLTVRIDYSTSFNKHRISHIQHSHILHTAKQKPKPKPFFFFFFFCFGFVSLTQPDWVTKPNFCFDSKAEFSHQLNSNR